MSSTRFDWYQSQNSVTIDVFVKNLKPEHLSIAFDEFKVSVSIKTSDVEYEKVFELSELVNPDSCKYTIGKVKVEIILAKKESGKPWKTLEAQQDTNVINTAPKYPTSAKNPINSDSLQLDEIDPVPTGEAAVNALFQKIYADASDETRRAMMKSFIESKGTVLSTNWDEVGAKEIKPVPPKPN